MIPEGSRATTAGEAIARPDLAAAAAALVPMLRAGAAEAEMARRLPDDTIRALDEAGLMRMLLPTKRGGESDAATVARVMTHIASGCASTAWVMSVYAAVARLVELLSEEALAEIYASPNPKTAGVFGKVGAVADRTDGGFRVQGRGLWPFNSGCHHAGWDLLLIEVIEADGARWRAFSAVPMSELTICDDWDVMGALGTGSSSVACGELFIPEHRVARVPADLREAVRSDTSVAQRGALPLGIARHALEAFLELARTKGIGHLGYARMTDAPVVQSAVARSAVDITMMEAYQELNLAALTGGTVRTPGDELALALGSVRCFELARDVIERLFALCPASEALRTRPLQRLLRDVHVFERQHAATPFINYEQAGRALLTA